MTPEETAHNQAVGKKVLKIICGLLIAYFVFGMIYGSLTKDPLEDCLYVTFDCPSAYSYGIDWSVDGAASQIDEGIHEGRYFKTIRGKNITVNALSEKLAPDLKELKMTISGGHDAMRRESTYFTDSRLDLTLTSKEDLEAV